MPRFGERKYPTTPAASVPAEAPEQRLAELSMEAAGLINAINDRAQQRELMMEQEAEPELIEQLAGEDNKARIRLQQIERASIPLHRAIAEAREQQRQQVWQEHWRPALGEAEERLTTALAEFQTALQATRDLHNQAVAAGFSAGLHEFVPPPAQITEWCVATYASVVRQRREAQPSLPQIVWLELDVTPVDRFKPRKVVVSDVYERLGAFREPRRIRVNYGPVRTSNLQCGYARLHQGWEGVLPAVAAQVLVESGVATFTDVAATAELEGA